MFNYPKIVVVIVSQGRNELLKRTLLSLASCELPDQFIGTIVVENIQRSGVEDLIQASDACLKIRYLFEPSSSKSRALNRALEQLSTELVIFFDDDIRLSPDILKCYADAGTTNPTGKYFGGPTGVDYDIEPPEWLKRFLPPSAVGLEMSPGENATVQFPSCFLGFNWAAFAHDLKMCGGFNPVFGHGQRIAMGEESYMQYDLNRRGLVGLYLPDAEVWHYVPEYRCSVQWILKRAYPNGLSGGAFAAHYTQEHQQELGFLSIFRKAFIGQFWRVRKIEILTLTMPGRFMLRYAFRFGIGFILGYKFSKDTQPFALRPEM